MRKSLSSVFFLALLTLACDSANNFESAGIFGDKVPDSEAVILGPAPVDQELNLVIGLPRSQEALAKRVEALHQPDSPSFHDFRKVTDLAKEFGASDTVKGQVLDYLMGQGINLATHPTGGFLHGSVTVAALNQLFDTQLFQFQIDAGTFIAPRTPPELPSALRGLVTEVLGLSTEPSLWNQALQAPAPSNAINNQGSPTLTGTREGCPDALVKQATTPNQLRTAYGLDELHQRGFRGQGISMALVEGASFQQSYIDAYANCFGIDNPVVPQVVQLGEVIPDPQGEPFLDIETIFIVAPQLSNLFVFQTKTQTLADWVTLFSAPLDEEKTGGIPIQVYSASLGNCEIHWGATAINLLEYVFMNAAGAGIHTFISAGDSGSSTCYHHDGVTKTISAEYPATSKYVVGVGGTNLALNDDNTIFGEGVWNDLDNPPPHNKLIAGGGGGPSQFIERPSWQVGTNIPGSMRTSPDVAFFADPFPGYTLNNSLNGWTGTGGTSAATPFFAASIALLLQVAQEQDLQLDLTYHLLYTLANGPGYEPVFQDVVLGDNDLFDVGCCTAGLGYDMASGWGSLNITALVDFLLP